VGEAVLDACAQAALALVVGLHARGRGRNADECGPRSWPSTRVPSPSKAASLRAWPNPCRGRIHR
jgi:hypothetical protein